MNHSLNIAFYMPYTRAWELLTGSALALNMMPVTLPRWVKEVLGGASLLLLVYCMAHYTSATLFPGPSAFPVCIASAMLLKVGEGDPIVCLRPLRWRPVVYIGLISYSLYLWHWPILVLLRLGLLKLGAGETWLQRISITLLCIAIAGLSQRFVEQPFRLGRLKRLSRNQIFAWSAASSVALALFATVCIAESGFTWRFSPRDNEIGQYLGKAQQMREGVCFYDGPREIVQKAECLTPAANKKNILLLGDSHAAMFWYALQQAAPEANIMQFNVAGCYPFPGHYDHTNCGRRRRYLFEEYLPTATMDEVVLSIRWVSMRDVPTLEPLLALLAQRHIPVYLIGPVPEYQAPLPLLIMLGDKWSKPDFAESRRSRGLESLDEDLGAYFHGRPGITYISAYQQICPSAGCRLYLDESHTIPIMTDNNHLTNAASLQLIQAWLASGQLSLSGSVRAKS